MALVQLGDKTLTFLSTGSMSLKAWARVGMLTREVALYKLLAKHLDRVNFVTYGGRGDRSYEDYLGDIKLLSSIWTRSGWINRNYLSCMFREEFRQTDILKTNQIIGSEVGIWLKKRFKCKLITRCGYLWSLFAEREGNDPAEVERAKVTERRAFAEADVGVVTTEASFRHVIDFHGIDAEKIRVVPNYVDTELFTPAGDEIEQYARPTIVYVGRCKPQKNLKSLLRALALLRAEKRIVPDLRIIGGGQGPHREQIEGQARELDLIVHFHGNIPNETVPSELHKAHVYILPSIYEGHPKTLLEAMACGMPVIGTDTIGIREDIEHGVTGYLCQTDPESIAGAIDQVFGDSSLQEQLGINARRYILENYSLEKILALELAVLTEVAQL